MRAAIRIDEDMSAFCRAVLAALAEHPGVYCYAGELALVRAGAIVRIDAAGVVRLASEVCEFSEVTKNGVKYRALKEVEAKVVLRGDMSVLRKLNGVVRAPQLLADGRVLQGAPGYDVGSGLLYAPDRDWPLVPELPTKADAAQAYALLAGLFADVEFSRGVAWGTAASVSCILTLLGRHAWPGAAPMFCFDSSVSGAGKGYLRRVCCAVGGQPSGAGVPAGDTELRKQLSAAFIAGRSVFVMDNVQRPLGGPALNVVLTEPEYSDRILGKSESHTWPNKLTMLCTGVEITLADPDTERRILRIRQEPTARRLGERTFSNDLDTIEADPSEWTIAALTLLRAYVVVGSPGQQLASRTSYGAWSRNVAAPLVWVGGVDPFEVDPNGDDESANDADEVLAEAFAALNELDNPPMTAGAMVEAMEQPARANGLDNKKYAHWQAFARACMDMARAKGAWSTHIRTLPTREEVLAVLRALKHPRECDGSDRRVRMQSKRTYAGIAWWLEFEG